MNNQKISKWSKYVTRRLAVQVAQAWNFGWGKAMKKIYGISVENTLVFRDQNKTEYYVDQRQHNKYVAQLYTLLGNQRFLMKFHQEAKHTIENILQNVRNRFRSDFSQLPDKDLLKIYQDFILPSVEQFYIRMWTVFNIGEPLANIVRNELDNIVHNETDVNRHLLNFSSPLKPNDVLNERKDILELLLKKTRLSSPKFLKKVQTHKRKYQHIPMFDFDHELYDMKHFLKELQVIKKPKEELLKIQALFKNRSAEFQNAIRTIKPNKKLQKLLIFLKENVFLRDYRDMIRQKLNVELRVFYQEVARRLGLNIEEVATLTNQEIVAYLKSSKIFPKNIVKRRKKAYLLIQKGSHVSIYSGSHAIKKARKELRADSITKTREAKGIIGSLGKAKGRAKIIYTNKDLSKIKKGDVMIATMTRQDFVPAMRKAVAIVTDEGSVTAHAAIIARELKIPCLVATKIAMKVFKDGDMVEVDAIKGVVRKYNL